MTIDPKADARRLRSVFEDWREPELAENARRWLISVTLDSVAELAPKAEFAKLVPDLLAMPIPTLRATAIAMTMANGAPDFQVAARACLAEQPIPQIRERLFAVGRTLAAAGDVRVTLAQGSAREWLFRALAAAVELGTRVGESPEPRQRQRAALNRLSPAQLAASARSTSREERFANALAALAHELAAGRTPAAVTYRGL